MTQPFELALRESAARCAIARSNVGHVIYVSRDWAHSLWTFENTLKMVDSPDTKASRRGSFHEIRFPDGNAIFFVYPNMSAGRGVSADTVILDDGVADELSEEQHLSLIASLASSKNPKLVRLPRWDACVTT